jgi:hypothetical protein
VSLTDLFLNQKLCVALAPAQISAAVRRGRKVLPGSELSVSLDDPEGDWRAALAGFDTLLQQAGAAAKGLPLSLALSSRWCHLAMLPWSDALFDEAGAHRFMEAQFVAVFGESARGWVIACDDAPYGHPRLACAIDRDFLDGLNSTARAHGHTIASAESVLSIAWRALARPRAFALAEPGRLLLAAASQGRIVALQVQPCRGPLQEELPRAWQRWTLRAPELAAIEDVALVNLGAAAEPGAMPARFRAAALPSPLAPAYAAVAMMGTRWR